MTGRASKDRFDYVIIGSGSAGSVVAARLAEDPTVSVLLLEAGPADQHLFIQMPAAVGFPLTNDRFNWFYNSEPEPGLGGRPMYAPRGRVLGGTSSINGMNWVRGNPWDYDNWDAVGAKGWSYADVLPYFKKSETYDQGPSAYRGGSGPMKIETSGAEKSALSGLSTGRRGERPPKSVRPQRLPAGRRSCHPAQHPRGRPMERGAGLHPRPAA